MNSARTWNIRITHPAPAMTQDTVVFEAARYTDAVKFAHEAFLKHRRSVTLGSGKYGMENWHRVDGNGVATDRNTNGGVPQTQRLL